MLFFFWVRGKKYMRKIPKEQIRNRFHFTNMGLSPDWNVSFPFPSSPLEARQLLAENEEVPPHLTLFSACGWDWYSHTMIYQPSQWGWGCARAAPKGLGHPCGESQRGAEALGCWDAGQGREAPGSGPRKPAQGAGESQGRLTQGFPQKVGWHLGVCKEGREEWKGKKSTATYVNRFLWGSGEGQVKKMKAGRNIISLEPSACPWARFPWTLLQRQGCRGAEREPWARSSLQRGLKPPALEAQDPQQLALWAGRSSGEHSSAVCFHTALWSCQTHTELRVFREILDCLYW